MANRDFIIKELIFFYRINSDEILEAKLSYSQNLIKPKEGNIKILGYSFPTKLNLDSWGRVKYDKEMILLLFIDLIVNIKIGLLFSFLVLSNT